MVIAYHVIFGAYGFWLPNDPRGSWSTEVWASHLRPFGGATKVNTRQSLAGHEHDRSLRLEAKQHLQYPPVQFTPLQTRVVGDGFGQAVADLKLDFHACSIMSDHVHLVVGRYRNDIEYVAGFLKRAATRRLNDEHVHPLQGCSQANGRTPSPWVVGGWFVYLNSPSEVHSRIRYVEENPTKAGLPPQQWPFVRPYAL
jgi:REP element-mobilizing transposase RayT